MPAALVALALAAAAPRLDARTVSLGAVKHVLASSWGDGVDTRWSLVQSADGRRLAYAIHRSPGKGWLALAMFPPFVGRNGTEAVVVDGAPGRPYEGVGRPVFSPDGRRVAYRAVRGDKFGVLNAEGPVQRMVVVDDAAGPVQETVGVPVWSADSRRVAYRAGRFGAQYVVVDGAQGRSFDAVGDPVWHPDGTRVAYLARRGADVLLVDGEDVTPVAADEAEGLAVSPDGTRLAFKARRACGWAVVVDGVSGPAFDAVGSPVFAPDGRLAYAAWQGGAASLRIEGDEPAPADASGAPVFSADGRGLAYRETVDGGQRVVIDGAPGPLYDEVAGLVYGPDGRHAAYAARRGALWRLVVDDVEGPAFDVVSVASYALAPWAREEQDGAAAPAWRFAGPTSLRFVTFRKGELLRWEVEIVPR